jgi:hypothetical protein
VIWKLFLRKIVAAFLSIMGLFRRNKGVTPTIKRQKGGSAPVKEMQIPNETSASVSKNQKLSPPPRRERIIGVYIGTSSNKTSKNSKKKDIEKIGRAIVDPGKKSPNPIFRRSTVSAQETQVLHLQSLFQLSQKFVEETPIERRQSTITATTATDQTCPGPVPFGKRPEPNSNDERSVISQNIAKQISMKGTSAANSFLFFMKSCICSEMCGPTGEGSEAANEIRNDHVLPLTPEPSFPIHEICFSNEDLALPSHTYYAALNRMQEVKNESELSRSPSFIKRDASVLSQLKIYVDESELSVASSALTTPSVSQ